jgi:NAD-dependent SIR2 family protein deacetylase
VIDPLVLLTHAVYSNKGVYAVLLGSGMSSAAGIPTGWEITLELVRRIAKAEGVAEGVADPAAWFQMTKGREPEYSALLDMLAVTAEERRAILHRFIEPTQEEAQAGLKVPTAAHRALAGLTARGYIRVILTTNFDRLTETALRQAGVEPTVISSADDAVGSVPLTHAGCVVVKLNGDYLDTRIRNTPAELAAYDPRMNQYLDRVLDEFGLIVLGW